MHRVDTGFIVHNDRTYPHLLRLFRELGRGHPGLRDEHVGALRGLRPGVRGRPRPRRPVRPAAQRAARPLPADARPRCRAFHRAARALLAQPDGAGDDRLHPRAIPAPRAASPPYFVAHFMTPLVSAVWSCAPTTALRYPAALPVPLPRPPRHARPSPARRRGGRSPAARAATSSRVAQAAHGGPHRHPGTGRAPRPRRGGREITTEDGTHRRTTRSWWPSTPTRRCGMLADPTDGRTPGPRRLPLLAQPHPAAHRHLAAAPRPRRRAPPGTT